MKHCDLKIGEGDLKGVDVLVSLQAVKLDEHNIGGDGGDYGDGDVKLSSQCLLASLDLAK